MPPINAATTRIRKNIFLSDHQAKILYAHWPSFITMSLQSPKSEPGQTEDRFIAQSFQPSWLWLAIITINSLWQRIVTHIHSSSVAYNLVLFQNGIIHFFSQHKKVKYINFGMYSSFDEQLVNIYSCAYLI